MNTAERIAVARVVSQQRQQVSPVGAGRCVHRILTVADPATARAVLI